MATAAVSPEVARPIATNERIQVIDALRGFALFGILFVNLEFFDYPITYMMQPHTWAAPDRVFEWVMKVFFQGKFYTLFSFLFGFGFSIYLAKKTATGKSTTGLFARRLLVLLAIGFAHAYFIWVGDILNTYALFGFPLLLFRNRKPKTLLIWAAVLLLIPAMAMTAGAMARTFIPEAAKKMEQGAQRNREYVGQMEASAMRTYSRGTFAEATRQRAWEFNTLFSFVFFPGSQILAMFLVGLWAGKTGLFVDAAARLPWFDRMRWVGLGIGLPLSLLALWASEHAPPMQPSILGMVAAFSSVISHPAMAMFYAFTVVILFHNVKWRARFDPIRSAGRMALTNYLIQSLICTTIFYGYGLGYFGRVPLRYLPLFVVVIYGVELAWSGWWLRRFEFGPAEWMWRSLTYGRLQPMRRVA